MADSPYRKYQDSDGDNKHDACKLTEHIEIEEQPCPDDECGCTPNPNAIVPNWRTQAGPFLNEKTCDYSAIVITCKACGDDFELASGEYLESGIRILLKFYNKVESDSNVETLMEVAQVADYHLGGDALIPRNTSVMKVLVTVPACDFNLIEDERPEQVKEKEEEEEEPEEGTAEVETSIDYKQIPSIIRRLKFTFTRYAAFQKAMWLLKMANFGME